MSRRLKTTGTALALLVLTGCATLSPDGDLGTVQQLTQGKTGGVNPQLKPDPQAIQDLLAQPLSAESAVRIALLNSPQLQASLASDPLLPYGEVLDGVLSADPLLSVRGDTAEECWRIVEPTFAAWKANEVPMEEYPAGSLGPDSWSTSNDEDKQPSNSDPSN